MVDVVDGEEEREGKRQSAAVECQTETAYKARR